MSRVQGKVAVVTGAGSGIGRELAIELARRGARVALSDVDVESVEASAARVRALGAQAHVARLDVSDRHDVEAYARVVHDHFGVVHQIYNNAGIAGSGARVLESDWEEYERVLAVDLHGVIHGTRAFLPYLIASGDGHVVNVSSLNGFAAQPTLSAYSAAKFGVRGFTETLRSEMLLDRHPVRVSVVHPGGVRTGIADAAATAATGSGRGVTADQLARFEMYRDTLLRMPAATAARIIVDGVEAGSPRILVGNDARAVDALVRVLPRSYPRVLLALERRTMAAARRVAARREG